VRLITAILFCLLLIPGQGLAREGDGAVELGGSLRTIALGMDNYDFAPFFDGNDQDLAAQTILRMTAQGSYTERISYEVHLVQNLTYTTGDDGGDITGGVGGGNDMRYRVLRLSADLYDEVGLSAALVMDRLNLRIAFDRFDLTLGRQAITFGKAYFWNPLDEFLPFDPSQFDRDYKPGVDAVRMDIPLGDFSGINLVAAGGRTLRAGGEYDSPNATAGLSWHGSALIMRAFTNMWDFDLALQGGKVYGGYQLGGALAGDLGEYQLRLEAAYVWAENSPALSAPLNGDVMESRLVAVAGLSRRLSSGLNLESELLYNDAGDGGDLRAAIVRVGQGASLHLSRWVWGFRASYEIMPVLTGSWVWLVSLDDASWQTQPSLVWSLSDEAELILGLTINRGDRPDFDSTADIVQPGSEFGSYADYIFVELKWYF
jgi:hypothetical protein